MSNIPTNPGYSQFINKELDQLAYTSALLRNVEENLILSAIANTDYQAEIQSFPNEVLIPNPVEVETFDLVRGDIPKATDLQISHQTLNIDKAIGYKFGLHDFEIASNYMTSLKSQSLGRATYKLKRTIETDVLDLMRDSAGLTDSKIGDSNTSTKTIGFDSGQMTPLDYLAYMSVVLQEALVPEDNGNFFLIAPPRFIAELQREGSHYTQADKMGDGSSSVKNGPMPVYTNIHGFDIYRTTFSPTPGGTANSVIIAGHKESTTFASKLQTNDEWRDYDKMMQMCQGAMWYGRKVIRPDFLAKGYVNYA